MVISNDLKQRIILQIKNKEFNDNQIIDIFKISRGTFYKIKNNLKSGSKKKPIKRKTKITDKIKKYILKYVVRNSNFKCEKLIFLVEKNFNTRISKSSIYSILSKNKIKKKQYIKKYIFSTPENFNIRLLKMKEQIMKYEPEKIISIDETSIDNHICVSKGWSKKGKKINKIINDTKIRYTLISSISNEKNVHNKIVKNSCNGAIFVNFIKNLIGKLSKNENYGIILDNASIHRFSKLYMLIKNRPNIELIYNVPYCPEYNPIERFFGEIKKQLRETKINKTNIIKKIKFVSKNVKSQNLEKYFAKSLNDLQMSQLKKV